MQEASSSALRGSSYPNQSTLEGICFAVPFGAIDSIETIVDGDRLRIHATKRFDSQAGYLAGHFPEFGVFPGVFIIECLAQAVAYAKRGAHGETPQLLEVSSARFFAPILPGNEVSVDAEVVTHDGGFLVDALCTKSGVVCARLKSRFQYGA
jgi:3-hydroxyacyl-[acyl-carrier-protein] dehydratase